MNDAQPPLTADADVIRTWLTHLYAGRPGLTSVCSDADGWKGRRFTTDPAGIEAAVDYVMSLDRRRPKGTYAQVTTLREHPAEGRGGEDLAYALTHLWADGDYGTIGHKPSPDDRPAPPDADAVAKVVTESGLPEPTGWTYSGGGYNPVWMLTEPHIIGDDEDRTRVKELTTGLQAVLAAQADRCGWSWDTEVGNLDRLMKLPGTINRKEGLERPTGIGPGSGTLYDLADLTAAVAELAPAARELVGQAAREKQERKAARLGQKVPPPRTARAARPSSGDGPLDVLADRLTFGDVLEPAGFTYEGRHSDGREKWLRPATDGRPSSAYSLVCDDHVAVNWSERSDLPVGRLAPGHKLTIGTLYAHLNYGGDTSGAARDIMRAAAGRTAGVAARLPAAILAEVKRRSLPEPAEHTQPIEVVDWSDIEQKAAKQQGQEQAEPRRSVLFRPASQIKIKPVRWLWDTTPEGAPPTSHGRIPMYSLALAAGGPGLGKSQFAVWMTARITTGTLPGQLWGKPRAVVYAAAEDSWSYTIAPRLIAAGADLDLVFHVAVRDDGEAHARLTLPLDTSLLGQEAERHGVALLVMDPLLSFIDKGINDYRAAEVRQALEPLVSAADRHGFTLLGLAHFTKNGSADPLSRVAGSGAFGQLIRCLIAFAKEEGDDGDDKFVMSLEKNNLGRLGLPSHQYMIQPVTVDTEEGPSYVSRFALGPETNTSVRDVMREEGTPAGDRVENDETRAWLRDYLADLGGCADSRGVIKDGLKQQYSKSALYRARTKLGLVTRQSGFGKAKCSLWYLPEAAPLDDGEPIPDAH